MESIITKIHQVKGVREELAKMEQELRRGLLTDAKYIEQIYGIVQQECQETNNVAKRKVFIFLVIMFYSPDVLTGRKLHKGMRRELKKYIKDVQQCTISYYVNGLYLNYKIYKDFRNETQRLYGIIVERLGLFNQSK